MKDTTMEEQPAPTRPKIQWGQPAVPAQVVEAKEEGYMDVLDAPDNPLAAATAVLDVEREKHEKRCVPHCQLTSSCIHNTATLYLTPTSCCAS